MFNVFIGKNHGYNHNKKYNSNDIINKCPLLLRNKIVKFCVNVGVYMGEFEDSTTTSFENYSSALEYAKYFLKKLNQKEVLISSLYPQKNFKPTNYYTFQCENTFKNLAFLINSIKGATIYTTRDKIVVHIHDFYETVVPIIMKLKKTGLFKINHHKIFVQNIENEKRK